MNPSAKNFLVRSMVRRYARDRLGAGCALRDLGFRLQRGLGVLGMVERCGFADLLLS